MKHWPFTVINDSTRPKVKVDYKGETKTFYPEEISSMVLLKMKEIAEAYLGKVIKCIIFDYKNIFQSCIYCWLKVPFNGEFVSTNMGKLKMKGEFQFLFE